MINLYSNAVKFTDRNGTVMILVEKIHKLPKDILVVSVVDTGMGIKMKDQDKLFKLFGSIKNQKKNINTQGIGLGLVISKIIVEKFNGKIDFIS
jgi:K+-sensing histidine kinase KdpD